MPMLSENQKETIRKEFKEELPAVFFYKRGYKREQLEEIAATCGFYVSYSSDFRDYCSNVLSEALECDQVPKLIEEINKVIIKEELAYLYDNQRDRLEEIARTSGFNVPHSPSFEVYCSNVVSEAEKHGAVTKLLQKVLSQYPPRHRLQHILVINRKFETVTKQEHRQKPSVQTEPLHPAKKVTAPIIQTPEQPQPKKLDNTEEVLTPILPFPTPPDTLRIQEPIQSPQPQDPDSGPQPAPPEPASVEPIREPDDLSEPVELDSSTVRPTPAQFFSLVNRHKLKAVGVIALIILLVLASFAFSVINNLLYQGSTTNTIGVCDGNCFVDPYRLDRNLKQEAADAFNRNDQNLGCQDLRWAAIGNIKGPEHAGSDDSARSIALDSADAEAKIYYADRCTNIPCPCISYVAVVQMAYQEDPQYSNDSDYINGVARGVLQGAYVKQNEWNASHPKGPGMYIFVANIVAGYSNQSSATQTQDVVAQQIQDLQKNDQTHRILGVIGLPFGSNELETKLNAASIPMVSTTPMSAGDVSQSPYLFSVVPPLKEEIQDILDYCNQSNSNKILYYYNYHDYYSSNLFNSIWNDATNNNQKYESLTKKITTIPYSSSIGPRDESIPAQAASSDADLIVFIGPMTDTVNFLTQLRNAEKNYHIRHKVLSDDNAYQWVYKYFGPDPDGRASRVTFENVYFVSFAYPDLSAITRQPNELSMLSDFSSLYDPDNRHSGNIYTHQRASSDAILAYDALSVLVTAEKNLSQAVPTSLDGWGNKLQQYISHNSFPGVSGQIAYKSGNLPDQKIILLISVVQQKNAVQQTLSGQY